MDAVNQGRLLIKPKPKKLTRLQQEAWVGMLFLSPWLTDFHMLTPEATKFIGLANYLHFFRDTEAGANLFGSLGYFC